MLNDAYYNTDYGTLTNGCKVRLYKLLTTQTQGQNIDTFVKTENDIISVYGTKQPIKFVIYATRLTYMLTDLK